MASPYQRFGTPRQTPGFLSPEEKAAKDAGFSSVLEQQLNRTLRNQLEQTALGKGYTDLNAIYSEAQRAAGGGQLSSNATLQKMYEYVAGLGPYKKMEPPKPEPEPTVEPVNVYQPKITETEKKVDVQEAAVEQKIAEEVKPPAEQVDFQAMLEAQAKENAQRIADLQIASDKRVAQMQQQTSAIFEAQLGQSQQAIQNMQIQMAQQQQAAREEAARQAQQQQQLMQQQQRAYQQQQASLQSQLQQQSAAYQQGLADLSANQRAFQINQARAAQTPELQIGGDGGPQVGGTAPFKRRRDRLSIAPATFGQPAVNLGTTSVLNV